MAKRKKVDKLEFETSVAQMIRSAESFVDTELTTWREEATNYFQGRPFGNEVAGRSAAVVTEVRDTIRSIAPQVMRSVFGPEHPCAFEPTSAQNDEQAKQATDYLLSHVFMQQNDGFMLAHDILLDGLTYRTGVSKRWWDEREVVESYTYRNCTPEQMFYLATAPGNELVSNEQEEPESDDPAHQTAPTYTATIERRKSSTHYRIEPVPPEEFIYLRGTRRWDEARLLAHRRNVTRSELVALGISEVDIEEHGGGDNILDMNAAAINRSMTPTMTSGALYDADADEASEIYAYCEAYIRFDYDGDGISELRRVCTIGAGHHIVSNEPVPRHPFNVFLPFKIPHSIESMSVSDLTMDVQKSKSFVFRAQLDALAASLFPRYEFVEGKVSSADILNPALGAPIRTNAPGMVREISLSYKGDDANSVLAFLDNITERRTGQAKGAMGLDADALQSSTKNAVNAAVDGARQQTELLARMFVETYLRPLLKGMLADFKERQPKTDVIKLRGKWVDVDVSTWDEAMDVRVSNSFGAGFVEERLNTLSAILDEQKLFIATFGPNNPAVGVNNVLNTIRMGAKLRGFENTEQFFNDVPDGWAPPPPAPPGPTPEQQIAQQQAQMAHEKSLRELAIQEATLQLERQKLQMQAEKEEREMQFQYDKLASDTEVKRYAAELQFHAQDGSAQLGAEIERQKMEYEHLQQTHSTIVDAQTRQHEAELAAQTAAQSNDVTHAGNTMQAMVDHHNNERSNDIAEQAASQPDPSTQSNG